MTGGKNLPDQIAVIHGLGPVAPSSSTPDYISLKDVRSVEAVITCLNGSGVTGSAITLVQAKAVAGTNATALAFTKYYKNEDPANSSVYTAANASSNTFTTTNTNSLTLIYRIPIDPASLDRANGFDCVRVGTANAVNTTVSVHYIVKPAYAGKAEAMPNQVVD
jgi:hypothetical protein